MGLFGSSAPGFEAFDPDEAGTAMGQYLFGDTWTRTNYNSRGVTDPDLHRRLQESEAQFAPGYLQNALNLQNSALFGMDGTPGLMAQQGRAADELEEMRARTVASQRSSDISDVESLGARATEAFRASDPQRQDLMARQTSLTNMLYDRADGLTPQEERLATQQAREGFAARGRIDDNASMLAEALNREEYKRANRQEAQQSGAGLFGMYQATAADPFQAVLGRPSGAMPMSGQSAYSAMGLTGQASPQLFNPDTGANLGLQNTANLNQYNSAVAGANAASSGAMMGGLFQGLGALAGGLF
jgi:hypothetical protein